MNPYNDGGADAHGIDNNPINCANIRNIGILSTPAVDTATNFAYVVSATGPGGAHTFKLDAVDLITGTIANDGGLPILADGDAGAILAPDGGTIAFEAGKHIQRPALALGV